MEYTKSPFATFFEANTAEILDRVSAWIANKCDNKENYCVQEGDLVIMIFIAHGDGSATTRKVDGMHIGYDLSRSYQIMSENNRKFPKEVDVYVVSNSCYLGIFADKVKADGQNDSWIQASAKNDEKAWPSVKPPRNRHLNVLFIAGPVRSLSVLQTSQSSPSLLKISHSWYVAVVFQKIAQLARVAPFEPLINSHTALFNSHTITVSHESGLEKIRGMNTCINHLLHLLSKSMQRNNQLLTYLI